MPEESFSEILDWMFTGRLTAAGKQRTLLQARINYALRIQPLAAAILAAMVRDDEDFGFNIADLEWRSKLVSWALDAAAEILEQSAGTAVLKVPEGRIEEWLEEAGKDDA